MSNVLLEALPFGLVASLTAACVLPLYPGFLAYIAASVKEDSGRFAILKAGLLVGAGVVSTMFVVGIIVTALLQSSLTQAIGIVSPIAFGLLMILGVALIAGFDISKYVPHIDAPDKKGWIGAYLYGAFFGAIVLPCNPAFIGLFFARLLTAGVSDAITSMLAVLLFGVGMALPLVILAMLSSAFASKVTRLIARHQRAINVVTGILLIVLSGFYLIVDFKIFG